MLQERRGDLAQGWESGLQRRLRHHARVDGDHSPRPPGLESQHHPAARLAGVQSQTPARTGRSFEHRENLGLEPLTGEREADLFNLPGEIGFIAPVL